MDIETDESDFEWKIYKPMFSEDLRKKYIKSKYLQPPFYCSLIGSMGSGKSNVIKNILFNKELGYGDYFDNIFLFIGSSDDAFEYRRLSSNKKTRVWNDKKEKYYKSKKEDYLDKLTIYEDTTNDELLELYDFLNKNILNTGETSLFIFDDMICDKILKNTHQMSAIDVFYSKGRHAKCSVIISSQKYNALKRNVRLTNSTHLFLFFGLDRIDLDVISKENSGSMDENEFRRIYKENVKKKYDFIIVNQKQELNKKFQTKNWKYIKVNEN